MSCELILSPFGECVNSTLLYAHTDSKEFHMANRKKFGESWYYYDRPFTYKFNKHGYRMNKELEEVNYDNHIAFFGCSYTVGIGLELEETFAYRLAKILSVDYINGALGGSSPDFALYNISLYLKTTPKPPKMIVVNWPQVVRTMFWYKNKIQFFLPNFDGNSTEHWEESYKEYAMEDSNMLQKFNFYRKNIQAMCKFANIKLIEVSTWQGGPGVFYEWNPDIDICHIQRGSKDYDVSVDRARDIHPNGVSHPGKYHQQMLVEYILSRA